MPREAIVQERKVRAEQVEDAAIFAQNRLDEEPRLLGHRVAQPLVEIREQAIVGPLHRDEVAQKQPLPGEVLDKVCRAAIGDHPTHLLIEHLRRVQRAARPQIDQLIVRDAAPEEERQP